MEQNNVICRTCMQQTNKFKSIWVKINLLNNEILITELLVACASIQLISETDGLPQNICEICEEEAKISYKFKLKCEKSDKQFRSTTIHSTNLSINDTNFKEYKCQACELKFKNATTLRRHRQLKHMVRKLKISKTSNQLDPKTCEQCGKTFQYRASMLKHLRKHNAPPKTCSFCEFKPTTPNKLAQHMEELHSHLKTIICTTCGKTFFKETNLRLHMVVHSGIKKHTCEICGVSFALGGNLSAHRRLHTGEKPYTCSHCGRGFTQQSALRSHEAGHSDRRDHVCPECGAAFSRAGALRNHRKRHSSAKPFVCSMCGKAFTFSSERKRHMTIHTGDKNHVCEMCGRRFNRSTNLKVHRRIHTGETPHICAVCGKGFIQAHCLRTHMNSHLQSVT